MAGWIEKRPNGRYRARYRAPDGSVLGETFDLKRDAGDWLDEQRGEMARGAWVDPRAGKQTFEAWADEWAAAQDGWKDSTAEAWPRIRARLVTRVGSVPLAGFDRMVLLRLRADLAARPYAPATVKVTMAYAGMILRAAYVSRRIGHDPTAGLRAKRSRADERDGQVGPADVPTRAEALAILAGTPAAFRAGVALGLTGLRVGEVLGMTADRIDLATRRVTIDRQALRGPGGVAGWTTPKAEKVRTITVPGVVAVELRRHLRDRPGGGVLFRGLRGAEMLRRDQWYDSAWRPALAAAGVALMCERCRAEGLAEPGRGDRCECPPLAFRFHATRHWCASTMLAEGAPITAVAGHLGDTVETVSRTYAHWLRDDRDVPAEVLDRVLAPEGGARASAAER
jgi:integrase